MSGYPDANYAPAPEYPSTVGTSCQDPAPARFWKGGVFCTDVTIQGTLNVGNLKVDSEPIDVGGTLYSQTLFLNPFDGFYYHVLASRAPTPPS